MDVQKISKMIEEIKKERENMTPEQKKDLEEARKFAQSLVHFGNDET